MQRSKSELQGIAGKTFHAVAVRSRSGKSRKGAFTIQRQSMAKKMRAKLQEIKASLARRLHEEVSVTGRWLRSVVQGWFNYHAVPGNFPCLDQFPTEVQQLWRRALRRRSQRGRRWNRTRLKSLFTRRLPKPKILHPYPNQRFAVTYPREEPYEVVPHLRICAGGPARAIPAATAVSGRKMGEGEKRFADTFIFALPPI